jgi:phosphoglycolate phosphatase-like HAD superfamily hydrolase
MTKRFVDRFEVILLDMGRTFMFDSDRFELSDSPGRTYRQFGGRRFDDVEVHRILSTLVEEMVVNEREPAHYENHPSLLYYLKKSPQTCSLPPSELALLEKVFTEHEIGTIPASHIEHLRQLRRTHPLGIVSDIWSGSERFLLEFERLGIRDLFDVIVFSSDVGAMKPSAKMFAKAMEAFDVDASKAVYIGDRLIKDVAGAKNFGMSAIWIRQEDACQEDMVVEPDLIVNDLSDVLA